MLSLSLFDLVTVQLAKLSIQGGPCVLNAVVDKNPLRNLRTKDFPKPKSLKLAVISRKQRFNYA